MNNERIDIEEVISKLEKARDDRCQANNRVIELKNLIKTEISEHLINKDRDSDQLLAIMQPSLCW